MWQDLIQRLDHSDLMLTALETRVEAGNEGTNIEEHLIRYLNEDVRHHLTERPRPRHEPYMTGPDTDRPVHSTGNLSTPKLNIFRGEEFPGNNEVTFNQWILEVRSIQGLYPEAVICDVLIKSLKGTVADFVKFGVVAPFEILMQSSFFALTKRK